jgi:hypothetical protein
VHWQLSSFPSGHPTIVTAAATEAMSLRDHGGKIKKGVEKNRLLLHSFYLCSATVTIQLLGACQWLYHSCSLKFPRIRISRPLKLRI